MEGLLGLAIVFALCYFLKSGDGIIGLLAKIVYLLITVGLPIALFLAIFGGTFNFF